ncbi:hypothetical protein O3S80_04045 [Streptomyces sp. Lzd4kr]|nr:hypothetical protein [Streptomyces sp. Lzd4kr]
MNLTDQQLNDIETRAQAATKGPWGFYDGSNYADVAADLTMTSRSSYSYREKIAQLEDENYWDDQAHEDDDESRAPEQMAANAAFIAAAREDVPALVAEVRRLRAEVAALTEARRLEWVTAHGQTPHTPRLCECGHSHLAHTVPAPHSCFAHGQTCPCEAYRQLPHDEAVAQLERNRQAAVDRAAAAAPDPVCGDENDGDWCELEPGHDGHHRADTAEWAASPA